MIRIVRIRGEPTFSRARPFSRGLAQVWLGAGVGYIGTGGKFVWKSAELSRMQQGT